MVTKHFYSITVPFIISLLFYILLVYPALFGTFELDDNAHLSRLDNVYDLYSLIKYSFYQFSTDGKRFISMLTFGLQANNWPEAYNFKLVNLIIHLINSLLVYWLIYQLSLYKVSKKDAYIISSATTLLWLFAPIHIFATFYIIQRMTLLAAFFTLLGCNIHILLRSHFCFSKLNLKYYLLISLSILTFTFLGIFSKENGILLCLFILITESAFLPKIKSKVWQLWKLIFLWGPLSVLLIYLILNHRLSYQAINMYPFTSIERFWNESIILWEYIYNIIIPTPGAFGLINDDIKIVYQWTDYHVIISFLAHITVLYTAFKLRKSQPVLFWGIFWFYGGHLLESTFIRLELYFDHRNYLPALGIYTIITYYLLKAWQKSSSSIIKAIMVISISLYLIIYGTILRNTAIAFSSEQNLTHYQYLYHPNSRRAQIKLTNYLFNSGQYKSTSFLLNKMIKQWPNDISLQLYLFLISDSNPYFAIRNRIQFEETLRTGPNNHAIDLAITEIFNCVNKKQCHQISYSELRKILSLLKSNPNIRYSKLYEFLIVLESKTYSQEHNWQAAIKTLQSLPEKRITRIDYYFIILQNQYMAKDFKASQKSLEKIEKILDKKPVIKTSLGPILKEFSENIKLNLANEKASTENDK